MSPPSSSFSRETNASSSPSIAYAFVHSLVTGVEVATYFCTVLMKSANGWMSDVGHYSDHSS